MQPKPFIKGLILATLLIGSASLSSAEITKGKRIKIDVIREWVEGELWVIVNTGDKPYVEIVIRPHNYVDVNDQIFLTPGQLQSTIRELRKVEKESTNSTDEVTYETSNDWGVVINDKDLTILGRYSAVRTRSSERRHVLFQRFISDLQTGSDILGGKIVDCETRLLSCP